MKHVTQRIPELFHLMVENVRDYAIFLLNAEGYVQTWNVGAQRIKGYTEEEVLGRHYSIFYPEGALSEAQAREQLRIAEERGRYEMEGWRIRKDGSRFWAHVVLTPIFDEGQLVGFGKITGDMTAEREAREQLAQRERQLANAQQIAHLGSWEWDVKQDRISWSDELYRIFGLEIGTPLDLDSYIELIHPGDSEELAAVVEASMESGTSYLQEHRIIRPDGTVRWVQSRGEVVKAEDGSTERLLGTALDITELKAAEERTRRLAEERVARQEAEEAAQRMEFLAQASAVLSSSLDFQETLANVATTAVPQFADWCAVDLLRPDGSLQRVGVAHQDPERVRLAQELEERYPADPDAEIGVHAALRRGEAELMEEIPEELLLSAAQDDEHRRIIEELQLRSSIVAPILIRERAVGAITFVQAESGRRYGEEDLVVARELASRAALAIDNAQLHSAEQEARTHAERARERTARLQTLTARLSGALRADAVARVIVEEGVAALGAVTGAMAVLDDETGRATIIHSLGIPDDVLDRWREFDADAPLPLATALQAREPVLLRSIEERAERYPDLAELRGGSEAVAAIPLVASDELLGSIAFGFGEPRAFTSEDRDFLDALAHQSAQALERARLYEVEHAAREAAEAASLAKSQFVAMMSHELRTPLSAILGYQELLSEGIVGPVSDEQKDQLARIRASATHLRDLINQILSMSRIEAGKEELVIEHVDLSRLIEDVLLLMENEAAEKDLLLQHMLPEEPAYAKTDAGKVRQILLNLISNAIKFTDDGSVSVTLEAEPDQAVLRVQDTGMGIDPKHQDRVFEAFTQVDQSMTRRAGGSGLGLPVSRRLAQLLGGDVTLESTPGVGSTFTLTLPWETPPDGVEELTPLVP